MFFDGGGGIDDSTCLVRLLVIGDGRAGAWVVSLTDDEDSVAFFFPFWIIRLVLGYWEYMRF